MSCARRRIAQHHAGLNGFTPEQVFTGRYIEVATARQRALNAQYQRYPMRFVWGAPQVKLPPQQVAINPTPLDPIGVDADRVNFPTLTAAGARTGKSSSTLS
ncbi:MAG: hypothetical protein KDK91_27100 [Gammaproteobacteria bacterium]|nr:hypothetical protein [Gammaproteobacteria bacterium]